MAYYRAVGDIPPKRHTQHRDPDGHLYYEELMGEEGFSSDSSLLYHRGVPSAIVASEVWELPDQTRTPNHPLKPRHLRLHDLQTGTDAVTDRRLVLGNNDVRIGYVVTGTDPSPLYRNAIGDECVYVEVGSGTVETVFGVLSYRAGDYVVVPRATTHRWVPAEPSRLYPIEANSHVAPPKRYLSRYGQLLEHAPYCERDLRLPEMPMTFDKKGSFEVRIKSRDLVHSYQYSYHPLDVVGWDGCYYPYCFNIDDFSPIVGKHHMPPPTHQTFEAHNFVICSFCPRPLDFHPQAIVVPYNHSNLDSDEVLYYVEGNYKARKGIEVGSLSLHPQGIPHGPHPGTPEATIGATHTNELAVMCDTFAPLYPTQAALDLDDLHYPRSWEHGWEPGEAAATAGDAKPKTTAKSTAAVKGKKSAATKSKAGTKTTRSGSAIRGKAADTWS